MKYLLKKDEQDKGLLCDKVTVKGFDYYLDVNRLNFRDVATNNQSSHIPKVVDEVEKLAKNIYPNPNPYILGLDIGNSMKREAFKLGYNKSQETHPFSEEDMVEFAKWSNRKEHKSKKDLLEIWKSQQPKVIYYND